MVTTNATASSMSILKHKKDILRRVLTGTKSYLKQKKLNDSMRGSLIEGITIKLPLFIMNDIKERVF